MQPRLTINVKEAQFFLNKGERSVRNLMDRIRKKYGKEKHQLVTVAELCEYTGLVRAEVEARLF